MCCPSLWQPSPCPSPWLTGPPFTHSWVLEPAVGDPQTSADRHSLALTVPSLASPLPDPPPRAAPALFPPCPGRNPRRRGGGTPFPRRGLAGRSLPSRTSILVAQNLPGSREQRESLGANGFKNKPERRWRSRAAEPLDFGRITLRASPTPRAGGARPGAVPTPWVSPGHACGSAPGRTGTPSPAAAPGAVN